MVEQGKSPGLLAPRLKPQVHALNICRAGCEGRCRGETQTSQWPERSCRNLGRQHCACETTALLSLSPRPCPSTRRLHARTHSPAGLRVPQSMAHLLVNAPAVRAFPDGSSCLEHDGGQVMLLRSLRLCTGCPSAWGILSQSLAWPSSSLLGSPPQRSLPWHSG